MTHGCTDCGYDYMGKCVVYKDGTCKRDRAEANTKEKRMTNYEFLKKATVEDIASFFAERIKCEGCFINEFCDKKSHVTDWSCRGMFRAWLEEEKEI